MFIVGTADTRPTPSSKLAAATQDDGQPCWYNVDTAKGQTAQA